jgi:hypothetical protein
MVKTFPSDLILLNIQVTSVHCILSDSRMKKTSTTKREQDKNGEYLVIRDAQESAIGDGRAFLFPPATTSSRGTRQDIAVFRSTSRRERRKRIGFPSLRPDIPVPRRPSMGLRTRKAR